MMMVQYKTQILRVNVECFLFVYGSGITMTLIVCKSTSMVPIYFATMNQLSMSISSTGKKQNTPWWLQGL